VGKVWILDTETKGTGANMVPLDRVVRKPGSDAVEGFVLPALKPPAADPAGRALWEYRGRLADAVDG